MLDLRSVVVTGVLSNVICTLVVVSLWRQNRRRFPRLGVLAADYVLQCLGLFLIVLRGSVPDALSIVVANVCVVAGALCGLWGLQGFTGRKGPQGQNAAILGVFFVLHVYWTYAYPCIPARSANVAFALLLICAQCVWLLLRRVGGELREVTRGVGVVFVGYCLLFSCRLGALAFFRDPSEEYFRSGVAETVFHVCTQMLFLLLTYALVLMVNRRLLMEVQLQEEKYSKAFHSAPYAILLTRLSDGQIIEANEMFYTITGHACGEVLGKTTGDLRLWEAAEDRASVVRELDAGRSVRDVERCFRRKSGELFHGMFSSDGISVNHERFLLSSVKDITERKRIEAERERLISERERALSEVKVLSGLLPICASCKKIRDEDGRWAPVESYVRTHSQADFSHGLCPECAHALYPEFHDDKPTPGR